MAGVRRAARTAGVPQDRRLLPRRRDRGRASAKGDSRLGLRLPSWKGGGDVGGAPRPDTGQWVRGRDGAPRVLLQPLPHDAPAPGPHRRLRGLAVRRAGVGRPLHALGHVAHALSAVLPHGAGRLRRRGELVRGAPRAQRTVLRFVHPGRGVPHGTGRRRRGQRDRGRLGAEGAGHRLDGRLARARGQRRAAHAGLPDAGLGGGRREARLLLAHEVGLRHDRLRVQRLVCGAGGGRSGQDGRGGAAARAQRELDERVERRVRGREERIRGVHQRTPEGRFLQGQALAEEGRAG